MFNGPGWLIIGTTSMVYKQAGMSEATPLDENSEEKPNGSGMFYKLTEFLHLGALIKETKHHRVVSIVGRELQTLSIYSGNVVNFYRVQKEGYRI